MMDFSKAQMVSVDDPLAALVFITVTKRLAINLHLCVKRLDNNSDVYISFNRFSIFCVFTFLEAIESLFSSFEKPCNKLIIVNYLLWRVAILDVERKHKNVFQKNK